jgi:hypothetical protein
VRLRTVIGSILLMTISAVWTPDVHAQTGGLNLLGLSTVSAEAQKPPPSVEMPGFSVPQNRPCSGQPKSFNALTESFDNGRVPSPAELTGAWVAIGAFTSDSGSMNCSGLTRSRIFENVMFAEEYVVEMHMIGSYGPPTVIMAVDSTRSLTLALDLGTDVLRVFRCRYTARKTLACLIPGYYAFEYKKMRVKPEQVYRGPVLR